MQYQKKGLNFYNYIFVFVFTTITLQKQQLISYIIQQYMFRYSLKYNFFKYIFLWWIRKICGMASDDHWLHLGTITTNMEQKYLWSNSMDTFVRSKYFTFVTTDGRFNEVVRLSFRQYEFLSHWFTIKLKVTIIVIVPSYKEVTDNKFGRKMLN